MAAVALAVHPEDVGKLTDLLENKARLVFSVLGALAAPNSFSLPLPLSASALTCTSTTCAQIRTKTASSSGPTSSCCSTSPVRPARRSRRAAGPRGTRCATPATCSTTNASRCITGSPSGAPPPNSFRRALSSHSSLLSLRASDSDMTLAVQLNRELPTPLERLARVFFESLSGGTQS